MTLAGQQLGHYRLVRLIGQGGMGEVYLAQDTRLPRQVAVKVIRYEHQPYPDTNALQPAERLFQREMKALSLLDHPHILNFHDFGEEQSAKGSLIYMVMPYRPEGSLTDWLLQRGSTLLPWQDVSALITQAASALQHAHDHQIVHQDVKPSNFLVRTNPDTPTRPDLFLVDFGIAKVFSATSMASQSVRGTATYMAPEQWSGEAVPATDQYALAIMAYQLLTGQLPFQGRTQQIMFQHMTIQPPLPSQYNTRLSPAVDAVLLRALGKKAEERFPNIKLFALALQQALSYTDLQATLEITSLEAQQGGQRVVTLPGQRQVAVMIPPNVQQGQRLQLKEQGMPYYEHGPRGALLLTLSIAQGGARPFTVPPEQSDALTVLSGGRMTNPSPVTSDAHIPPAPPIFLVPPPPPRPLPSMGATPATPFPLASGGYALTPQTSAVYNRPKPSQWRTVLIVTIALLVIVSSLAIGGVIYNTVATNNTDAVATAQAIANSDATTTALNANATTTAQAIADDNATATAQAQATATFIAANADPYQPAGTVAWVDPLSQPHKWQEGANADFGGKCQFVNGAFQITQTPPNKDFLYKYFQCDEFNSYSNFAFEVKMTINQGDCGGLTLRSNTNTSNLYLYEVCQDGSYYFYKYTANSSSMSLTRGNAVAISKGLGQLNVVAVVANGSNYDLYVNGQKVDTANDSTYGQGILGLVASAYTNPTAVTYQDARVWTI